MFKNDWMEKTYQQYRNDPPESDMHMLGDCYWRGYNGQFPGWLAKGTQAYAAWAAGRDNAKRKRQ